MKKHLLIKNTLLLTVTAIILRGAGMIFRIYIAGQIGDEGMGLFQLVLTIYNLGITVATTGVAIASTRMVAIWLAKDKGSPKQISQKVLLYSFVVGAAAGIVMFVTAYPSAKYVLSDTRAVLSLQIVSISLPFMAAGAALRGCFTACRNVKSSSTSQIFEQAIRIILIAVLMPYILPLGIKYACALVVLGSTISEVLSAIYMWYCWRKFVAKGNHTAPDKLEKPLREYCKISWPVTATRGVGSILVTVENVLVPAALAVFFCSRGPALAAFGQLKAMAMPLLFFPFSFLATISTLLLPDITDAHAKSDEKALKKLVDKIVLVTMLVSGLMSAIFTIFSVGIGEILYKSSEIGFYLGVLGPLMPCMYLESMVDGVLRGMGEQISTFKYRISDSIIRIVGIALVVPHYGMKGFLFIMICSNLFTCGLNLNRMMVVTKMRINWIKWMVNPAVAIAAGYAAYKFVYLPVFKNLDLFYQTAGGISVVTAVYILVLWIVGGIPKEVFPKKKIVGTEENTLI